MKIKEEANFIDIVISGPRLVTRSFKKTVFGCFVGVQGIASLNDNTRQERRALLQNIRTLQDKIKR